MAKTASVNLSVLVTGTSAPDLNTSWTLVIQSILGTATPALHQQFALANANNTIAIPTNLSANILIVVPPSNSTLTKTIGNASGGQAINPTLPFMCPIVAGGGGNFVISANGVETIDLYWF